MWGMDSTLKVKSLKNQALIADKCIVAERFVSRLKGLIGTTEWSQADGILFPRCNSIHMWMMKISIDVVFLKKLRLQGSQESTQRWIITSLYEGVKPWKILPLSDFSASDALELPNGKIRECELRVGDELCTG